MKPLSRLMPAVLSFITVFSIACGISVNQRQAPERNYAMSIASDEAGAPAEAAKTGMPAPAPPPGMAAKKPADGQAGVLQSDFDREAYDHITENDFYAVKDAPLSTFSVDVDTASYSNVRRRLNDGKLPPAGAVRIEELINYFPYDYPQPKGDEPFSVNVEFASCPWKPEHRLVKIGLKGRLVQQAERPAANLVFLLDVSGSMQDENKLPLVKKAFKLLANQLTARDKAAIVVYAGATGLALPSTSFADKQIDLSLEILFDFSS